MFAQFLAAVRGTGQGKITLICGGEKGRLLAGLGAVDETLAFESLPMEDAYSDRTIADCRLPGQLARAGAGRCGLLVSCLGADDPLARQRLNSLCGAGRSLYLPVRPPAGWQRHLVDLWCEMADIARGPVEPWPVRPEWSADARVALGRLGVGEHDQFVIVHPGSGSPAKCWPLEHFVALAGAIAPLRAVFVLGPVELERWGGTVAEITSRFPTIVAPSLTLLAGLCGEAVALVGNDSGPAHLAATVGTPTVALFGPTSAVHFAPLGLHVTVMSASSIQGISVASVAARLRK